MLPNKRIELDRYLDRMPTNDLRDLVISSSAILINRLDHKKQRKAYKLLGKLSKIVASM